MKDKKTYGVSHGTSGIHWRDGAGWTERLSFLIAKIGLYFLDIHVSEEPLEAMPSIILTMKT